MFYCSKCGVLDEKGTLLTHRCSVRTVPNGIPNIPNTVPNKWPTGRGRSTKPKAIEKKPETTGTSRIESGTPAPLAPVLSASQRSTKWKKENPEKYREYQRELMRKRRNGEGH